jgi:RHS repeat-associated protein
VKSAIIQSQDYYPFGLTFNSYQREDALVNRFRFQGQEHVDAIDLGWDAFKWRNHQPDIGRFFNIDPLADKYVYNSPYAFSENKVVAHVELEGLESAEAGKTLIKQEAQKVWDALKSAVDKVVTPIKELYAEVTTQHPEDVKNATPVDEKQTSPQTTDTKWLGGDHVLFNPNEKAEGGKDGQTMTTTGGQKDVKDGTGTTQNTWNHEVNNTSLDTVGTTGNVGSNGEIYNSYYVIQNGKDTIDDRHYVPSKDMPKNTTPATKKKN